MYKLVLETSVLALEKCSVTPLCWLRSTWGVDRLKMIFTSEHRWNTILICVYSFALSYTSTGFSYFMPSYFEDKV